MSRERISKTAFRFTCDRCGLTIEAQGETEYQAELAAWAEGWDVSEKEDLCDVCVWEKEHGSEGVFKDLYDNDRGWIDEEDAKWLC